MPCIGRGRDHMSGRDFPWRTLVLLSVGLSCSEIEVCHILGKDKG